MDSQFDGIIGLAYQNLAPNHFPIIFVNMYNQNLIDKFVFSIYLNRNPLDDFGGAVIFGDTDGQYYRGQITYVPVTQKSYWQFTIDNLSFGCLDLCVNGCQAIADTGTSLLTGRNDQVQKINAILNGQQIDGGMYQVDCSKICTFPIVVFQIGARSFILKPKSYIIIVSNEARTIILLYTIHILIISF